MRTSGAERESMLREENRRLREQLQSAQEHGALAEAFIVEMDMGYRWAEWLEPVPDSAHKSEPSAREKLEANAREVAGWPAYLRTSSNPASRPS